MAITMEYSNRLSSAGLPAASATMTLEDKFEIIKDIGDGSFGSVALARVRTAGAHVAKRGTMIAIKTMKKTFESFTPCLELREVIFLRSLPNHVHLVPALDIFLDPTTKKLHICMEYMDGNLYQLMKAREHRCLDGASVKSILYQILSGLDHIHNHKFFHRDIKPENILISTSSPVDSGLHLRRYSSLVTPPSTPPTYSVKIADFGLARETHSKLPYTTYVSTRWYRAPEVLLRAGEYSAPVDMWALGAMAVEIATLKPLFPGGNEVDQVWRVCEIMGSPGNWFSKNGQKIGGGDWRDGTKLAQKLGFSFPKMAPHSMDSVLPPPQWPQALGEFVTWCLMWDPKNRPTSYQAMQHEYFVDAVDPLVRASSRGRLLGRKQSTAEPRSPRLNSDGQPLNPRASWFRKSLIGRDSASSILPNASNPQLLSPRPSPSEANPPARSGESLVSPVRQNATKRATWANGPSAAAPMPILPSIRPISPLSHAVTAQAVTAPSNDAEKKVVIAGAPSPEKKKLGRQLSLVSHGNHYGDVTRGDGGGAGGLASPTNGQKESFFSHLRKRARRFSGRNQLLMSPRYDDGESNGMQSAAPSNRSSMLIDPALAEPGASRGFTELDRALQNVRYGLEDVGQPLPEAALAAPAPAPAAQIPSTHILPSNGHAHPPAASATTNAPNPKRSSSLAGNQLYRLEENQSMPAVVRSTSRTRRVAPIVNPASFTYETPDEEEELLDEALHDVQGYVRRMDGSRRPGGGSSPRRALGPKETNRQTLHHAASVGNISNPYPTPSPSAKRSGMLFTNTLLDEPATPIAIVRTRPKESSGMTPTWPTPPSENEWATAAAASIYAAGAAHR